MTTIDPLTVTTSLALDTLKAESLGGWGGAIYHAHGRYDLNPVDIEMLDRHGITQDGVMHDATAEAIRNLHPNP